MSTVRDLAGFPVNIFFLTENYSKKPISVLHFPGRIVIGSAVAHDLVEMFP